MDRKEDKSIFPCIRYDASFLLRESLSAPTAITKHITTNVIVNMLRKFLRLTRLRVLFFSAPLV